MPNYKQIGEYIAEARVKAGFKTITEAAPALLSLHCKFNCRIGFYHHIAPDPDLVNNLSKLVLRLFDHIDEIQNNYRKYAKRC